MGTTLHSTLSGSRMNLSIKVSIEQTETPLPLTSFTAGTTPYMQREDREVFGGIRSCASCPAVFVLKDDNHNLITKQWQYYMLAINPSMTLENVALLLDNNLAFTNSTGLGNDDDPRADFFRNKNLAHKPPQFDKVRTCSRNCVTGIEQNGMLNVKTFDIRNAPPLKPGKRHPATIEEINPDDYQFLPQHNREMFVVANIVTPSGRVTQFPRGGVTQ